MPSKQTIVFGQNAAGFTVLNSSNSPTTRIFTDLKCTPYLICYQQMLIVLVDYDNITKQVYGRNADPVAIFSDLIEFLLETIPAYFPQIKEIELRLYGGWIDEYGYYSAVAIGILSKLRFHRGRRRGLRMFVNLAFSLADAPPYRLIGSIRTDASRPRQKMVDGHLMLDLITFSKQTARVAVVSDDDDLVPSVLLAVLSGYEITWVRDRKRPSCNDPLLSRLGVNFRMLRKSI